MAGRNKEIPSTSGLPYWGHPWAIRDIGTKRKLAFLQCHELLKVIAESRRDICAVPMRGTVKDLLDEADENPSKTLPETWIPLLNSAVDEVDEATMFQWIKDMHDGTNGEYEDCEPSEALQALLDRKDEWQSLPGTIRNFRMRRCIDRRFSGTPERRTRHYSDSEDDGGFW